MRKILIIVLIIWGANHFFNRQIKDLILSTSLPEIYSQIFRDVESYDDNHVVSLLDNGMKIIVNKHDRCVCRMIRVTGHWDANELALIQKIVKPDFKVIEVGGNFGCYTLTMADLVGKKGKIHSFEANSRVSKYLEASVKLNNLSNVVVYPQAASNKQSDGMMVYGESNIGSGHIINAEDPEKLKKICEGNPNCVPIKSITLDSVFKDEKIDLLKIDAEGAESLIIEGAEQLIKNNPDIIIMMEWILSHMKRNVENIEEFVHKLKLYGFNFWALKKGGTLEQISDADLLKDTPLDIVLCRNKLSY